MKKRKGRSLLLAVLFTAAAVAGCAADCAEREKQKEEPVTLTTILQYGAIEDECPEGVTPEHNSFLDTALQKLNIQIDWMWIAPEEQYKQKLNVALALGDIPDFMAVEDGAVYRSLLENDMILPWNEVLKEANATLKEWIFRDPEVLEAVTDEEGNIMSLPQYWDPKRKLNIMMIRKDWLEETGLEVPETVEELEKVAMAFQEKTGAEQGIGLTYKVFGKSLGSMGGLMNMSGSYPGAWIEEDGELVPGEISQSTKSALEMLHRFYEKGILSKEFPLYDYDRIARDVLDEKIGIVIAPFWEYDSLIGKEIAKNQDSRWVAVPIPVEEGVKGAVMDTVSIEKYWVISKKCKHPEAVMALFNQFAEFEEDYPEEARPENGFIWEWSGAQYIDPYDVDEMYESFNAQIATGDLETPPDVSNRLLAYWSYGKGYYQWKKQGGIYPKNNEWGIFLALVDEDGAWGTVRKLVEEGRYEQNQYYGLPSNAMSERQDVLNNMTEETFIKIVMGETPVDAFEEYRTKWLELGGQEMIEEVNQWYDQKESPLVN